jgi:hypothetical protein
MQHLSLSAPGAAGPNCAYGESMPWGWSIKAALDRSAGPGLGPRARQSTMNCKVYRTPYRLGSDSSPAGSTLCSASREPLRCRAGPDPSAPLAAARMASSARRSGPDGGRPMP